MHDNTHPPFCDCAGLNCLDNTTLPASSGTCVRGVGWGLQDTTSPPCKYPTQPLQPLPPDIQAIISLGRLLGPDNPWQQQVLQCQPQGEDLACSACHWPRLTCDSSQQLTGLDLSNVVSGPMAIDSAVVSLVAGLVNLRMLNLSVSGCSSRMVPFDSTMPELIHPAYAYVLCYRARS
jgi:hypothetical protein